MWQNDPTKQSSANKLSILHFRYLKPLIFLINCYMPEHCQYLAHIISFSTHNSFYDKSLPFIYHFKKETSLHFSFTKYFFPHSFCCNQLPTSFSILPSCKNFLMVNIHFR